MDIALWAELVQTLGLPVVLIGAMGWFIFKLWKQSAEREKALYAELACSREVNEKAITTIAQYAEKLGDIQKDVKDIKGDIAIMASKIERE